MVRERRKYQPALTATITHDQIYGFQKGGIVVDGNASADIENDTITGIGPTSLIAANGIQVSRGATAIIANDTVSGNYYTNPSFAATDVLLFGAGAGTSLTNDTFTGSNVGV